MTQSTQYAFDFRPAAALGRSDFLISDCNRAALALIERWPDWPSGVLVVHGAEGCGKTHLAHLWCARSGASLVPGEDLEDHAPDRLAAAGAVAIDRAETASERALLHLYNCCVEARASLLLLSRAAPAFWGIALPDLASRLRSAAEVAIGPPDDGLLAALLIKHFADRQLALPPHVLAYLVRRMERSFAGAARLAAALDRLQLSGRKRIGMALARDALEAVDPPRDGGA